MILKLKEKGSSMWPYYRHVSNRTATRTHEYSEITERSVEKSEEKRQIRRLHGIRQRITVSGAQTNEFK